MSYTTTHKLYRTKVTSIADHRNGWGSAPLVWSYLEEKYLPKKQFSRMITAEIKEVWRLSTDPRLEIDERFALFVTFDWAYCEVSDLQRGADLLDRFYERSLQLKPQHVNHWGSIARDYRTTPVDRRMLGICMTSTSVSDIWQDRWGKLLPVFEAMKEAGF